MLMLMVSPLKVAGVCARAGADTVNATAAKSSFLIVSIPADRSTPDRRRGLVADTLRAVGGQEKALPRHAPTSPAHALAARPQVAPCARWSRNVLLAPRKNRP